MPLPNAAGEVVYVGGAIGHVPTVVARSLRAAILETLETYLLKGERDSYDERWTCVLLDGEPGAEMLWTVDVEHNGKTYALYVQTFTIEPSGDGTRPFLPRP